MDFTTKIKELERELSETSDYKTLQKKTISLRSELNTLSHSLTSYEKEHFSNDIENVLKSINAKLSESKGKKRLFSFKQKNSSSAVHKNVERTELANAPAYTTTLKKHYVLEKGDSAFENLEFCTVTSTTDYSGNSALSGSLCFRNITKCVINLQRIFFQTGSIFITDCTDSIIFLRSPSDKDFQIRLRDLKNCKILIEKLSPSIDCKQVVIIENCHKCIFNASTRDHLIIQDFSNPFQSEETEDNSAFAFEDFDICNKDTMQLFRAYL
ncbi:CPS_HP_G0137860.mRNA.1.CDS.1 [Saccharomyces cerevisiae]|nr:Cin2p [Saccharomyces cerevisiae PE-2]CAI4800856.1 CNB_1a_G0053580.mRNA.1.CDS.1 [Saccharomyces cerevisiae]CAF1609288.1 Cin2p [Saccharomyces cerevisiae PE-2]CAI5034558.1 CPS_HP_G0005880.mRNA.1.CDS.1 [Saccharomyces cerevisiae]CAI5134826.1 CPS_HP_G0137860.mRNA.1.CDS.1 [Saccharomyces cerevisiae]